MFKSKDKNKISLEGFNAGYKNETNAQLPYRQKETQDTFMLYLHHIVTPMKIIPFSIKCGRFTMISPTKIYSMNHH